MSFYIIPRRATDVISSVCFVFFVFVFSLAVYKPYDSNLSLNPAEGTADLDGVRRGRQRQCFRANCMQAKIAGSILCDQTRQ